jgi:N-acetylmuramoyl-L-alanine amidase
MRCYDRPSPNFDERKDGAKPELIVIHYTAMDSAKAALDRLTDPASKVSAHYLIDEKGNIFQLVDEDKRAWHAGISQWQGKDDVNSRSIGIEISNRNGDPYTREQQFSLAMLCKDLMFRHKIPPQNVLGHSDVAPGRKIDPGEHFPWQRFSRHDIGRWPAPTTADAFNAAAAAKDEKQLAQLFKDAGYAVEAHGPDKPTLRQVIYAFQQRYEPEVFSDATKTPGVASEETVKKLRAVIRLNRGETPDAPAPAASKAPKIKPPKPPAPPA